MFCYLDKTVIFGKDIRDKHVAIFKLVNEICIERNNAGHVIYCLINLFQQNTKKKLAP